MEPNTEKNQQAEAQETAQETAKTAEATAAEETTATESAEQPETATAEAESTTEEDQHMKKKELKAALEKAEAALADHKDQHLRLMAEYQNYRNRTTEEEYQKCVNVVVEYINQHLGEDIDLKSLARISNFSPFYFHRIMKAFLGEPIGTFIVRTRTEAAARLLRYSDIPIADIAYRIGYSSPSSLSKVFRQFYGISPLEYRNNKNFVIMKPAIIRPDLELKSEIKSIPARNVIYIRLSGDYKLNDYGGTWGRLWQFIKEQKLPMGDFSPLCIYHDDPKVTPAEKLRTDVCMVMPVQVAPKGDVGFKTLPAGRYAIFLYKGPYDNLQAVYDTIYGKCLPEMECTLRDEPSAERYLNNPCETAPEKLLTEIYIPVE